MSFINFSSLEFEDISSEIERIYRFPGGDTVTIEEPLYLNVSEGGGHRVFDAFGTSHYIHSGWYHLSWTVKEGSPNFIL